MFLTTSLRGARTAVPAAVLAGSLVVATACGSGVEPPGAPSAAATQLAAPSPTSDPTPTPTPVATDLPWPARGAAALSVLQATADSGAQPWLLDPLDVAQAYAQAVHGWRTATVSTAGPDEVRVGDAGVALLVTVGQPARSGPGGIWVVTAERPA